MKRDILKTVVGSRAHGTALPESDYDYRGVFVAEPMDFISPFRNVKNNSWIEGDVDNTAYELAHFSKLCAHGNPSALELLVAPVVDSTAEGTTLRALLPKFLSKRCIAAFLGYSRSQEKKCRENHLNRKWKYAEAHTRTLYQLRHLLKNKELKIGWEGGILDELCAVKRGLKTDTEVFGRIFQLEQEIKELEVAPSWLPEEPDTPAIEQFLSDVYLPQK